MPGDLRSRVQIVAWRVTRWLCRLPAWMRRHSGGLGLVVWIGPLLLLIALWLALWVFPSRLVSGEELDAATRAAERNEIRGTLVQVVGGIVLVFGALATWRQVQLRREGQITDRYTRAVDQLGAVDPAGREKTDVQIGGIYALERIARDSPDDLDTIAEVLAAFVHGRAPWPPANAERTGNESSEVDDLRVRLPAVQAAMTVLARVPVARAGVRTLSRIDLRKATLGHANLTGAYLVGTNLAGAQLVQANLAGAHLWRANLAGAHLLTADLRNADLGDAHLPAAELGGANLTGAYVGDANLTGAQLVRANLAGAHLAGTILRSANLEGVMNLKTANLDGIHWDEQTVWPDGTINPPPYIMGEGCEGG